MATCIIFHSYSGITRAIAEKVQKACGGDLIEVKSRKSYNKLSVYAIGGRRAMSGESDPIEPETIDVSAYELLVIGTPVWAWRATPAINAAISALKNCEGKKAVIFATCGSSAGEALTILAQILSAKGVTVVDSIVLTRRDTSDDARVSGLIAAVGSARQALA
jgi:flavodoxin